MVDTVSVIMTDHGERQLWEAPRKDLEEVLADVSDPGSPCFSILAASEIRRELSRRKRIWKAYRNVHPV